MEQIFESKLNYLSESELDEFKFLPVMPTWIDFNCTYNVWRFKPNDTVLCQSIHFNKVMEYYYNECKKWNIPFI